MKIKMGIPLLPFTAPSHAPIGPNEWYKWVETLCLHAYDTIAHVPNLSAFKEGRWLQQ
jgi:hypothetical protein